MNLVALQKEMDRISDELRLSGRYTDSRFIEVRAEMDRTKLELEVIRQFLGKAFPSFTREFQQIKEEILQKYNPELEKAEE